MWIFIKEKNKNRQINRRRKKQQYNSSYKNQRIIAIAGITDGVGRRHFSIMVGNYLANVLGRKTAIVSIGHLMFEQNKAANNECTSTYFQLCGIDFYENVLVKNIASIIDSDYEHIIINIKWSDIFAREEFYRSNIKFIVGSLSKWRIYSYEEFLAECVLMEYTKKCICISFTGDKKDFKRIQKTYNIHVYKMPYEENPFYMDSRNVEWLQHLLGLLQ